MTLTTKNTNKNESYQAPSISELSDEELNAVVRGAGGFTPQTTAKNTFTPQTTAKNIFTPQTTSKNTFTPQTTAKNTFTPQTTSKNIYSN